MKYVEDYENIPGKEWPVRPYYKRELAEAYAPTISPASALNRLSKWIKAEFGAGRSPTAYRATKAPQKNIHLLAGGTYIQILGKTVGIGMKD